MSYSSTRNIIDAITRYAVVSLMAILVIDVIWQVFSRYALQSPSTFTDELARFLLIWISLLGAAYASGKNMHLAINLLPTKLNDKNRRRLQIFICLLICSFALSVMVIGGSWLVYVNIEQLSPSLGIPMSYVYSIVPLSGLLIAYYKIYDMISPPPNKPKDQS